MAGKLPPEKLERYVLSRCGVVDGSVIVGGGIGIDSAIIDLGNGLMLAMHSDPITGAVELLGWLAVNVVSNDIAVVGAKPRWLLSVLYLPEDLPDSVLDAITVQIDEAAKELGVTVIGGHTEYTPGLPRPMITMTGVGIVVKNGPTLPSGARAGDAVIVTKSVGLEGTAILATDFSETLRVKGVPQSIIESSRRFIKMVSVVRDALTLAEAGLATAMHDPTEGGLLGGLAEIAYASRKTIEVWEELIPIAEETAAVCRALGIDPLKLISSGTLVATVPFERVGEAIELLSSRGIEARIVGRVREQSGSLVALHRREGIVETVDRPYVRDELFRLWEAKDHH
ncbi:MAG: AIR synthase family protein [Ignisphaera sp.]|nr:AIR synthase family protein [Ignisphaera sp.]MDW8084773.1 AIR synthase family protein [Ignisphaera sp.]